MKQDTLLAAVDLGSNSFRLEIGRYDHGQIQRVEYLKDTVRLGNGLDAERNLTQEAMQRGWDCLARFAERIKGFPLESVRAVATQTLREAKNRDLFLARGQEILGFPIEVIAGTEEARLIYLGVSHLLPHENERRLVIDIGGRSTELILGHGTDAHETGSFRVGSVAWSMKYFADGVFSEQNFYRAEIAAQAVLEEALTLYPRSQWDKAYGASGTVGAVADILVTAGWPEGVVSMEGLNWLLKCLLRAGHADNVRLAGLRDDRRPVIGGGVSVLRALMNLLQIDALHVAEGALRNGVLFEMLHRDEHLSDARDTSIRRLAHKFHIDQGQSQRVANVALFFLNQTVAPEAPQVDHLRRKLMWASQLHEVGMAISHSDYHKHGAYILDNADMLGFSLPELHRLSLLVLGHRGKLKKLDTDIEDETFAHVLLALRLACILCHARTDVDPSGFTLTYQPNKQVFKLRVNALWTEQHPQSTHLLQQECLAWSKTDWRLNFSAI